MEQARGVERQVAAKQAGLAGKVNPVFGRRTAVADPDDVTVVETVAGEHVSRGEPTEVAGSGHGDVVFVIEIAGLRRRDGVETADRAVGGDLVDVAVVEVRQEHRVVRLVVVEADDLGLRRGDRLEIDLAGEQRLGITGGRSRLRDDAAGDPSVAADRNREGLRVGPTAAIADGDSHGVRGGRHARRVPGDRAGGGVDRQAVGQRRRVERVRQRVAVGVVRRDGVGVSLTDEDRGDGVARDRRSMVLRAWSRLDDQVVALGRGPTLAVADGESHGVRGDRHARRVPRDRAGGGVDRQAVGLGRRVERIRQRVTVRIVGRRHVRVRQAGGGVDDRDRGEDGWGVGDRDRHGEGLEDDAAAAVIDIQADGMHAPVTPLRSPRQHMRDGVKNHPRRGRHERGERILKRIVVGVGRRDGVDVRLAGHRIGDRCRGKAGKPVEAEVVTRSGIIVREGDLRNLAVS